MAKNNSSVQFGRIPPQSKDIESAILGAIILDLSCQSIAMSKLFPEIFYSDANQKIFSSIENLFNAYKKVDLLTVVEQLQKDELLDQVGGAHYVMRLTQDVVSSANIEEHIAVISEKYIKRETINVSSELTNNAYADETDAFDILNQADSDFQKIQERVLSGMSKDISHHAIRVLDQYEVTKHSGVLGIPTGMNAVDRVICGLVQPDLIIVAARPGQGKTSFCLTVTHNTSVKNKKNIPCAWFSLEMDGEQLVRKLASMDAQVDHERIRKGIASKDEEVRFRESINRITQCPVHIEDRAAINIRYLRTRCHLLKKKYDIQYIVVDYIQLMSGVDVKGKSRDQIVTEITGGLKQVAKELRIPVIALSQLNRKVEERADKMPQLSDLRESGGIEQDADEVIFLMRPDYYYMEQTFEIGGKEYSPHELTILSTAKNRHGATKNVPMKFIGRYMQFIDHPEDPEIFDHFKTNNIPVQEDLPF